MGIGERTNPFSKHTQQTLPPERDGVIDLRGRKLEVGDELILNTGGPIFFRVVDITPVLDPAAPPGMMRIEVGAAVQWNALRGQINMEFIRVRTADEAGPLNIVKPGEARDQE